MIERISIERRIDPSLGRWLIVAAALATASCSVGPNYVRPAAPAPASYKEAEGWKRAQPQDHVPRGGWWRSFGDPRLDTPEAQIVIDNQTIKAAEARVREARALTQQAQAAFFPIVTGNASATRSGSGSRSGAASAQANNQGGGGASTRYNLALDVNWEIDLWGRVRRTVESREAGVQANVADLEAAKLSAQALLAQDYFLLRVQDAEIRLLNDTVAAYEKSLQLTRNQYAVGVAARADVVQAQTQLKSTQAQAVDAGVQRAQLEHAIATLIGKSPADFSIASEEVPSAFPDIPLGVPSELLERRPDIAAAERHAAAVAAESFLVDRTRNRADDLRCRPSQGANRAGDRRLRRECRDVPANRTYRIPGSRGQPCRASDPRTGGGRTGRGRGRRARIAHDRHEPVSRRNRELPRRRHRPGVDARERARGARHSRPPAFGERRADQGARRRLGFDGARAIRRVSRARLRTFATHSSPSSPPALWTATIRAYRSPRCERSPRARTARNRDGGRPRARPCGGTS